MRIITKHLLNVVSVLLSIIFVNCATFDLSQNSTEETKEDYLQYIKMNAPSEDAFVAVQRVAAMYLQKKQYKEAADVYKNFRPYFSIIDKRFEKILDLLEKPDQIYNLVKLERSINTENYNEYCPIPTADEKYLYYCAMDRQDGYGGEDIYISDKKGDIWNNSINLGTEINTFTHEAPVSISTDGNRILLFGNYSESYGGGDLFYADKTKNGWSSIKHFPTPINSEYFDADGIITSEGNGLIFVSDRPGGIGNYHAKDELFHGDYWGNTDIYICVKNERGWSEPINLGPTINTPYAERTPFLHPDGKTLYFSSDGHYSLRRLDVYKATRLNDSTWTEWSEPINLGKEINNEENDWCYKISTSGDLAYFSATKNLTEDIYTITLPDDLRPKSVAKVSGTIKDSEGNILEANIKWEDLGTLKAVGELRSNPQSGEYFVALPLGKNYGYYAEKDGFYPVSKNIDLRNELKALDVMENIVLISIGELMGNNLSIRINNVFFDFDKYDLKQESHAELKRLALFIKKNNLKVEIGGFTDSRGTSLYNMALSKNRAQAVVDFLVSNGCNKENLLAKGYGESKIVSNENSEAGYSINRRVEFKVIK